MLDKFYYKLNLNFLSPDAPASHDIDVDPDVRWVTHSVDTDVYLHNDVKTVFNTMGLSVNSYLGANTMSLFRGSPGQYLEPHIDRGTCWAINCVVGSQHSDMIWYSFADGVTVNDGYEIATSNGRASYRAFRPDQLHEQARAGLLGVYLVRIDMPHSINNYDHQQYRWCHSLKDAANRWSWAETVKRFEPYMYAQS